MNAVEDAALVAAMLAVDASGLGGVCLRSPAGAARDQWLHLFRHLLPASSPMRRVPCNIADRQLLGGLDLTATLRANKPITEEGVVASIGGGVLVIAMAERLSAHTAALISGVLDQGGLQDAPTRRDAPIGIVALDEGVSDDEIAPRCLLDRVAFLLDFTSLTGRSAPKPAYDREQIEAARQRVRTVVIDTDYLRALCATGKALGAGSVRVDILAVRAARILAALDGRCAVSRQDAEKAGQLVLAPRASQLPQAENGDDSASGSPPREPGLEAPAQELTTDRDQSAKGDATEETRDVRPMQDLVLAAAQAAIPAGLLAQLRTQALSKRAARHDEGGRRGALRKGGARGRPFGTAPAVKSRARLNIIATLQQAAPWQKLRGRTSDNAQRLQIRAEDLRATRHKQRSHTLTIFAVDASGSAALNRLAEAKGAVELLLAECYVRRDQVAVIGFRGRMAEILLPPTRSLVRAKRGLSALPGGGGTPLAAAIDMAALLASRAQRRGESPTVVLLTDGRGNVARDGRMGRDVGQSDALLAARGFGAAAITALFVDTSPRPHDLARELARGMGARYVPLPFADARSLSKLVGSAALPDRARP